MVRLLKQFKPLFQSKARYYLVTGGRGSAKSFHVADFLLKLTYEEGHVILFTRYTMRSAHISIIPEFTDKIDKYNLEHVFEITNDEIVNKLTGSRIIFRGIKVGSLNQTANLKSIHGITTLVVDEAEELIDEEIFDKIDESVRVKGTTNRVILVLNPTSKEHWIYKRFYENAGVQPGSNKTSDDTTYIHTTYLDNSENISESIIRKFEKLKLTDPKKYEHRVLGGWIDKPEGVVIENWRYGIFNETLPYSYGLDYGFYPDPTALVKTAIDQKNKKIYVKSIVYKTNLGHEELLNIVMTHVNKLDRITCDTSEPRMTTAIRKEKFNIIEAQKPKGSIISGIRILQEYEVIVDPESTEIGKELNNYVWNDKKASIPIDDYNHAIDAMRYSLQPFFANKRKFVVI